MDPVARFYHLYIFAPYGNEEGGGKVRKRILSL